MKENEGIRKQMNYKNRKFDIYTLRYILKHDEFHGYNVNCNNKIWHGTWMSHEVS